MLFVCWVSASIERKGGLCGVGQCEMCSLLHSWLYRSDACTFNLQLGQPSFQKAPSWCSQEGYRTSMVFEWWLQAGLLLLACEQLESQGSDSFSAFPGTAGIRDSLCCFSVFKEMKILLGAGGGLRKQEGKIQLGIKLSITFVMWTILGTFWVQDRKDEVMIATTIITVNAC